VVISGKILAVELAESNGIAVKNFNAYILF